MSKIASFTDLKIWQGASQLTREIYIVTRKFPKSEVYGLTDQMRRASASVGANIAEGFGRYYQKEKIRFLYNARGSLTEVQNFIYIAKDLDYLDKESAEKLLDLSENIARSTNAFIKKIKESEQSTN